MLAGLPIFWFTRKYIRASLALCLAYLPFNAVVTGFGLAQFNELAWIGLSFCSCLPFIACEDETLDIALKILSFVGLIVSLYSILQIFQIDPIFVYVKKNDLGTPVGTFGQQTVLGAFLALSLAASLYCRHWLIAIISFAVLLKTGSSFTYLSAAGVIAVFGLATYPRISVCSAVISIFVFYITYKNWTHFREYIEPAFMDNGRFEMWESIYDLCNSFGHYFFGVGIGSFKYTYLNYQPQGLVDRHLPFIQAHNEYLQMYYETGMVGFILTLYLVGDAVYLIAKSLVQPITIAFSAILAAVLLNSLGNFPMHLQPHANLALIAFIVIANRHKPLVV